MQTTYDANQKFKTIHYSNSGLVTVYHDDLEQAVKFSGKFSDSYVCMHKKIGSNWKEIFKSQRGQPTASTFKPLKLND